MIKNPFYASVMRRQFEAGVKAYAERGPLLFTANGRRNRGNSWSTQFWRGYDGVGINMWDQASKASTGYAMWRAGRSVRASEERKGK